MLAGPVRDPRTLEPMVRTMSLKSGRFSLRKIGAKDVTVPGDLMK